MNLPFQNKKAFLSYIDGLPQGPEWTCTPIRIQGDLKDANGKPCVEVVEVWHRDPVEVVQDLLDNAEFAPHLKWVPERRYRDKHSHSREFKEMNSGDWWWDIQVRDGICCISILV